MKTWRLDRDQPLNTLPEFYETREAAERRAWALVHIAGVKCKLIVWEDVARYEGGAA
jgi:hypothetical protein